MPDSPTYDTGLLGELRRIIKDTSYESPQFDLIITDTGVTSATVEVTDGRFVVTIVGGTATGLDVSLSDTATATIEKLVGALNAKSGYRATLKEDGDPNHASTDLQILTPTDIKGLSVIFRTRRWSDQELVRAIDDAVRRHNLSVSPNIYLGFTGGYTALTIPDDHRYFILLLAQIEVLKMYVHDAAKRRGTDLSPADYDTLKRSLEDEYRSTLDAFLKRADQTNLPSDTGSGDISVGRSVRETRLTPKQGQIVPLAHALPPVAPTLQVRPLGAGKVLAEWTRDRSTTFWKYELWRGPTEDVSNTHERVDPAGALTATGLKFRTEFRQERTQWVDGSSNATSTALPPPVAGQTYYYRLYVFNRNDEFTGSAAVSVLVE